MLVIIQTMYKCPLREGKEANEVYTEQEIS